MTAPAQAPIVAHNRFPTTVVTPDGDRLRDARVVLTVPEPNMAGHILVWTKPGDPRENMPYDPAASTIGRPRQTWRIVTPAGDYVIQPGQGCGCGNRLKRWEPFTPMRMGRLP